MLTWRMLKKGKLLSILFFPNGTIQCVGCCDDSAISDIHSKLEAILNQRLPSWSVLTMTVLCELKHSYDFRLLSSSKSITYEVELFPAAQMTLWSPYHVHVFHNGKLVITGIKDISCVPTIVNDIKNYLKLKF